MKRFSCAVVFFMSIACLTTMGCAGKSPLITAASKGNSSAVQKLIRDGSNINETDDNGLTPLMHAIWSSNFESAKALLNMGAGIDKTDKAGKTALMYASELGNIEIMKMLLSKGADINIKDNSGIHALFYATDNGFHNATKLIFYADQAMKKGGIQEVQKACGDFREDAIIKDGHAYETYLNYRYLKPTINYKGDKKLSITVRDQRSYILSKEKGASYVGLFKERGLIRPYFYDIGTLSGKSLADDFTFCVAVALSNAGFVIENDVDLNNSKFIDRNAEKRLFSADRIISIEIQEWKTDTYSATGIYYDVTLNISDGNNKLLAKTRIKGEDNLERESWRSMYEKVPAATEAILSKMLNSPDIWLALKQ
jgi:hypothetical protein